MIIKIAVIEFDYHADVLRSFCRTLENSNFEISIFTTPKIWKEVGFTRENAPKNLTVYLKSRKRNPKIFFEEKADLLHSVDIIYFNTIASHYQYFSQANFGKPTIMRVHNVNGYFNTWKSLKLRLSYWFYDLQHIIGKSIWVQDWYYRKKLISRIDYYMFPNSVVTKYASGLPHIDKNKILTPDLPYAYLKEHKAITKSTDVVTATVIGLVEQKRRDYNILIKALKLVIPKLKTPFHLVLLGKLKGSYGQKVKSELEKLHSPFFHTKTFEEFVPYQTFEEEMSQSDFLIVPIKTKTRYQIYREYYGLTKVSGNENDMINYQKPSLFPSDYNVPDELLNMVDQFSDEKILADILTSWVNEARYKKKELSEDVINSYTKENIASRFEATCRKILRNNFTA